MPIAGSGPTNPDAGVIATSPATAPEAAPITLGFPPNAHDIATQVTSAAAAAVFVTTNAFTAVPSAARALPALKPNHPNQSSPAPSTTSGTLCGTIGRSPNPSRLPKINAAARAATPEFMWTTVPPAKSSAPRSPSQPSFAQTQWATGAYTMVTHATTNTTNAGNFIRSANAPMTRAGVIIANIAWKTMNA